MGVMAYGRMRRLHAGSIGLQKEPSSMVRLSVLALLAVLCACSHGATANVSPSDSWAMFQRTPDHNAVVPLDGFSTHWKLDVGQQVNGGFAVAGTTLFVDTFANELLAINAKNGKVLWRTHTNDVLMSTPVLANGIVYVGSGTNARIPNPKLSTDPEHSGNLVWGRPGGDRLIAFDARTGAQRWAFPTVGEDMPSPAIDGGTIFFANGDFHAYGLDAASGNLRWKDALVGPATMASSTLAGGVGYVSACDYTWPYHCRTYALDPESGKQLWSAPFGNSDCSPAYGAGSIFVSNVENDASNWSSRKEGRTIVTALDAHTGAVRWTYRSPRTGPYTEVGSSERAIAGTYAAGMYFQAMPTSDELIAFDARSGAVRWRFTSIAPIKMSPVTAGGRVFVGDTAGMFYTLNAATGSVLREQPFNEPFSVSPPVLLGNTILIADGHTIYAIL